MDSPSHGRRAQAGLFFGLVANAAAQSFLFVVLPPLGRRLGFSDIQTGAILSVSALLLIVSAPAWGYLSERIGRRPVLLIALSGAALAPAAYSVVVASRLEGMVGAVTALALLFAARAIQAIISGGLMPAAQAYMADVTVAERRASGMGLLGAAYGLGAIIGAAVAWRIGGANAVLAFALIAVLVGMGFAGVLTLVPEPARRSVTPAPVAGRLALAEIWPFLAITLIAISVYSILQQVTALRLQDALGHSSDESIAKAGAALMATSLTMIVVQGGLLRVLSWTPERLLLIGSLLAALAMMLGSLARDYLEIFGALVLFGFALGFMLPGNLASLSLRAGADAQGKAAGVNAVGQGLGMALGPLAGASLHQIAPQAPFVAAALLLVVTLGLSVAASRSRERATAPEAA